MPCLKPLTIKNPRYKEGGRLKRDIYARFYGYSNCVRMDYMDDYPPDYYITVPCGKCADCKRLKRNSWTIRILNESRCHPHSAFVTLTLSPASLRRFEKDPKKPLKLYIDRLRKSLGFRPRYIFVNELGDDTERLHYHGIIFGASVDNGLSYSAIRGSWKYGIVTVSGLTDARCGYVAKYILKQTKDFKAFVMCSNGIGANYVTEKNVRKHLNNFDPILYIDYNGRKFPLPTYYKNKMFTEDMKMCFLLNRLNDTTPFERKFHGFTFTDEYSYHKALSSFYNWTVRQKLNNSPNYVYPVLKEYVKNIEYGTVCFP